MRTRLYTFIALFAWDEIKNTHTQSMDWQFNGIHITIGIVSNIWFASIKTNRFAYFPWTELRPEMRCSWNDFYSSLVLLEFSYNVFDR